MDQKFLIAFEYGVILSQAAKAQGLEVDEAMVKRAEVMIEGEFATKTADELIKDMQMNVLSVFNTDSSPDSAE